MGEAWRLRPPSMSTCLCVPPSRLSSEGQVHGGSAKPRGQPGPAESGEQLADDIGWFDVSVGVADVHEAGVSRRACQRLNGRQPDRADVDRHVGAALGPLA